MKLKYQSTLIFAAALSLPSLSSATCNDEFQVQTTASTAAQPPISQLRAALKLQSHSLLNQILSLNGSRLSPKEIEGLIATSTKEMLDKGHLSWQAGYQSGLISQLPERSDPQLIEATRSTPRFKPLPKGDARDQLLQKIQTFSSNEREKFLTENGYRFADDGLTLEQNINQDPSKLFLPLHLKLNGIHERFSKLVGDFVLELIRTGRHPTLIEITQLRSKTHSMWMAENTFKVQGALAHFGIAESEFYSLSTQQVIEKCESIVGTGQVGSLSANDQAAVRQFTAYPNLGDADQLLDDQILFDHLRNLTETIRKVVDHRVSSRELQSRLKMLGQNVKEELWVKDAPILTYKITSDRFEDIPAAIREKLGKIDITTYSTAYLHENIGTVFALQVKDDGTPDVYIIGKSTYLGAPGIPAKYEPTTVSEVQAKNKKVYEKVMALFPGLDVNDPNLLGGLKKAPVKMYRFSQLGFPIGTPLAIQSPWGTQVRTLGRDAMATWNTNGEMLYMVNLETYSENPISYVPFSP